MDANVQRVQDKLAHRATMGLQKYGVTTERTDLGLAEWLRHLQEELIDGAVYAEAALAKPAPTSATREMQQALEAIIIRCEEGDKRTDWLPTIASIAKRALLKAQEASNG